MNRNRLRKIKEEIAACRGRGGIKASELEGLAKELGRVLSKRGKEPTWVSEAFPDLRPVSIQRHGSRDLNRFTAGTILDQLEMDVERWAEEIGPDED